MTKSNAFALPMARRSNEMRDSYGELICDYPNEVCAQFAVNAINHADALADALESMLIEHSKHQFPNKVSLRAAQALDDYRGAK